MKLEKLEKHWNNLPRLDEKSKAEIALEVIKETMEKLVNEKHPLEYKNEAEKFCFRYGVMIGELRKKAKGEK